MGAKTHVSVGIHGSKAGVKAAEQALDRAMQDAGLDAGTREKRESEITDDMSVRKEYVTREVQVWGEN